MERSHYNQVIIHLRRHHKWTQAQLAEAIGVNQSTISRIEKGDSHISDALYEQCFHVFGIHLIPDDPNNVRVILTMFEGAMENDRAKIKKAYQSIEKRSICSLNDYFYQQIALILYKTHLGQYSELLPLAKFINQFTFVFDEPLQLFNHIAQSYALIHNQRYMEGFKERERAYQLMYRLDIIIPLVMINYGIDNILLRRYPAAYLSHQKVLDYLPNDKDYLAYYQMMKNKAALEVCIDKKSALESLLDIYQSESILQNNYFRQELATLISLYYIKEDQFQLALDYLLPSIDENHIPFYTEICIYNALYCYRQLKQKAAFDALYTKWKTSELGNSERMTIIIDSFLMYDGFQVKKMVKNFPKIKKYLYNQQQLFTILAYQLFMEHGETLWKKRQYRIYKAMYDFMLNTRFAFLNNEL